MKLLKAISRPNQSTELLSFGDVYYVRTRNNSSFQETEFRTLALATRYFDMLGLNHG